MPFRSVWSSRSQRATANGVRTSERPRACPRVTGVCRLDKRNSQFAGVFVKPSDGLEPSTPSLPSWNQAGSAGTGGSSRARKRRKPRDLTDVTRACPRVDGLMFASRSHAMASTQTTDPCCGFEGLQLSTLARWGADRLSRATVACRPRAERQLPPEAARGCGRDYARAARPLLLLRARRRRARPRPVRGKAQHAHERIAIPDA